MSVVVAHPGVQHARELALALHYGSLLSCFVTSIGHSYEKLTWLPRHLQEKLRSRSAEGIPRERLATLPVLEVSRWALDSLLGSRFRERSLLWQNWAFDWIVARRVAAIRPSIVIGFENSCLHTFRRAKACGVLCVLDAASVHHSAQTSESAGSKQTLFDRVNKRKDEEIRLADRIVVLSSYARDTYLAAGVPADRITVIPPGMWSPSPAQDWPDQHSTGGIRFLFVGNVKQAKGVDLLLGAFARLDAPGKHLTLVGPAVEEGVLPRTLPEGVDYLGKLPRDAVYEAYSNADVLVLPSRADGFGFVVAEAMGRGLPVIVSSATGAKDLVEQGVTGWIFESGNAEDLMRVMATAYSQRASLADMGAQARQAVAKLTWDAYGVRVREFYSRLLPQPERADESNAPRP